MPIAVSLVVLFLIVAVVVIPRGVSVGWGVIYGLAVCSPAVMFGLDYGNIDIAVFSIVAGGALLLHRRRRAAVIGGESLLFLASILKLFPIVSIAALLRQRRRVTRLGALVMAVGFAIYFLADYSYLALALRSTSQSDAASYGMRRFTEWFVLGVNTISPRIAAGVNEHLTPRAWDVGVAVLIAVVLIAFRRRLRSHLSDTVTSPDERDLDLFWVGASIYVWSYVVFRSWDYRLAFVLLTIPQLLRWARMGRSIAIITLLALFGAMWLDVPPTLLGISSLLLRHTFIPWNHLTAVSPFTEPLSPAVFAQLMLFVGLLAGLVATTPRNIRTVGVARANELRAKLVATIHS